MDWKGKDRKRKGREGKRREEEEEKEEDPNFWTISTQTKMATKF